MGGPREEKKGWPFILLVTSKLEGRGNKPTSWEAHFDYLNDEPTDDVIVRLNEHFEALRVQAENDIRRTMGEYRK